MNFFVQISGKRVTLVRRATAPGGITGDSRTTLKPKEVVFGWTVADWIQSGPGAYKVQKGRPVKIG